MPQRTTPLESACSLLWFVNVGGEDTRHVHPTRPRAWSDRDCVWPTPCAKAFNALSPARLRGGDNVNAISTRSSRDAWIMLSFVVQESAQVRNAGQPRPFLD